MTSRRDSGSSSSPSAVEPVTSQNRMVTVFRTVDTNRVYGRRRSRRNPGPSSTRWPRYAPYVAVTFTWQKALALRLQRHLLDPIGTLSVARVVRRLCGVQTQVASSAELAVRVRREASRPGEVRRALSEGQLIKTWAMRGTLHL